MKVFAVSRYYERFVDAMCEGGPDELVAGWIDVSRYPNGETHVWVVDDVTDEQCMLVGSIAPPDEQMLSVLLCAEALRRNGAAKVIAFLPYLAYARQDTYEPGSGGGLAAVGMLLKAAGVDEVVAFDVHSEKDASVLGLPLQSLSAANEFAERVRALEWEDVSVVAPDEGAVLRSEEFAAQLGEYIPTAHFVKRRLDGVRHLEFVGRLSERVVLVDDIIDSGQTLVSACRILQTLGVTDIAIVVTHGLFKGHEWRKLFDLNVRSVFVSDSCPEARKRESKIHVVPLASMMHEVMAAAMKEAVK